MNTAQIKLVTWSVAGTLGVGMAAYVGWFLVNRTEILASVDPKVMISALTNVPELAQHQVTVVSYDDVKRGLLTIDWTGKPPPEIVVADANTADNAAVVKQTASDLLTLRAVRYDGRTPERSEVIFKYLSEARVAAPSTSPDGTFLKRPGDKLDEPVDNIKIVAVWPDSVEFAFEDDAAREHEFVVVGEFDVTTNQSYVLLADGVAPAVAPRFNPIVSRPEEAANLQTESVGRDRFRMGVEDLTYINEHYPEIVTTDVTIARHRDPVTKKYDGIEVKSVVPDSIAARHGVQEGDVIKSINGHPVTSKEEAIQFVKNNKDNYDVWEVEVWNRGQTRTITYLPPKKK